MSHRPDPIDELRMYADGELDHDAASDIQRRLVESSRDAEIVRHEQRLREAVGRVMHRDAPAAPADLAASIRSRLHSVDAAEPAPASVAGRVGGSSGQWASRRNASAFAIAASLLLVTCTVLFGIFGRQIDDVPVQPQDPGVAAAQFADREHDRCVCDAKALQRKALVHEPEEAARALAEHLRVERIAVPDLSALGYRFIGAGPCHVPGANRSGHLIYQEDIETWPRATVSVFIVAAGRPLCPRSACTNMSWIPAADARCQRRVLMTTHDSLTYFLVCCSDRDLPDVSSAVSREVAAVHPTTAPADASDTTDSAGAGEPSADGP